MTGDTTEARLFHRRTAWLYEPVRQFFEDREGGHQGLRADLNAARMGVTVDDYLARSAVTALAMGIIGALIGVALSLWLATTGVLADLQGISGTGALGAAVSDNRHLVVGIALTAVLGVGTGLGTWYYRYTQPGRRADRRARELSMKLPHAITYMYALSRGGLDVAEIVRRLAKSRDTYGEIAQEMGLIVNEMDYLGQDFMQAVRTASEVTPSEYTSEFFGDLHGVIESGGDVEAFLSAQREEAVQDARSVQQGYIENISLFAEVYVTVLVAGPLFLLILLMVLGITGSDTLAQVNAIVYLGIPAASVVALLVLDRLGSPFTQSRSPSVEGGVDRPDAPADPDAQEYAATKRRAERIAALKDPLAPIFERPWLVLLVSVPAALASVGLFVGMGLVEPTVAAVYDAAVATTTLLFVVPFAIAVTPLVLVVERRRRRTAALTERFPDTLSTIASANRMGIRPAAAIQSAAEGTDHALSVELRRVHNEIEWFDDLQGALLRMANRAETVVMTRALRLVVEADRASGNLSETLSVAADDARRQREFIRDRSQELSTYVAAAVISFLVYLGILLLIDQYYFQEAIVAGQQAGPTSPDLPISLQELDADGFRLAFFHSSLIQAVFIGLVAGKMTVGRALAGLKYSLVLLLVTVVAFGVF